MPNPNLYKGNKEKFISDCMKIVTKEEPSRSQEQKSGKCFGMWKGRNRKKKKEGMFETVRNLAYKMKNKKD